MSNVLLEVKNLSKEYHSKNVFWQKDVSTSAVKDVSFSIEEGQIVGLLGESGCGKSTTAKMILGLEKPTSGKILYQGKSIEGLREREFRPLRREIQMVFQNPFSCLDPRMSIKRQLLETLEAWNIGETREERLEKIYSLCRECGIGAESLDKKLGEFSGGQLQRIAIVRALLLNPKFLVADEIVSALDVSVQNQVLEILLNMKEKYGLTMLFITHDMAVIRRISDYILVMKDGELVEQGTYAELMSKNGDSYVRKLKEASYLYGL